MSRARLSVRVLGPAVAAAVAFSFRALPAPAHAEPAEPRAFALPTVHGTKGPAREQRYELDPERSSVRFLVEGPRGQLRLRCSRVSGELRLGAAPDDGTLTLRLDLAALAPLGPMPPGLDVRHVAGVLGDVEVLYRGTLAASTTCDLPGVTGLGWLGTIHFGARVVRQPMLLWRCSLPGRPLRLSGHGTVDGAAFGLPSRTWFGLFDEQHAVTLGLDLAWRRARER